MSANILSLNDGTANRPINEDHMIDEVLIFEQVGSIKWDLDVPYQKVQSRKCDQGIN